MTVDRLSLNTRTTNAWTLPEVVDGCVRAGIGHVGLWRDLYEPDDVERAANLVRDAGLNVSSLCRGGFFPAVDPDERAARIADNLAALDECAALGTDVLVLVCGGLSGVGLADARQQVADGIGAIAGHAADRGIRLALEPLHPVYCANRSVVSTLDQALTIAVEHPPEVVGVCIDTFHLWWDDRALARLPEIGDRIAAYQVCDWLDPLPDVLLGRGMPGDGVIDFAAWTKAIVAADYTGPIEVEIFNQAIWDTPGDEVLTTMIDRYRELVAPHL